MKPDRSGSNVEIVSLASLKAEEGEGKSVLSITEDDISIESGYGVLTEDDIKQELSRRDERQKVEFVSDFPRAFKTESLVRVVKISERPIDILQTLIYRQEWGPLVELLKFYGRGSADQPYPVVDLIENTISGNEDQKNKVFMMLSEMAGGSNDGLEDDRIVRHKESMLVLKKHQRELKDYQNLLGISQTEISALSGKKLLMIGGGHSPIKRELEKMGVDCNITNIDPIAKEDGEVCDVLIGDDFFDVDTGEDKYDEVWALFSLPTYAFTEDQVRDFYVRALSWLKQGGILRAGPITDFKDAFTVSMRLNRRPLSASSEKCLEELMQSDLFDVEMSKMDQKRSKHSDCAKIKVVGDPKLVKEFFNNKT